MGREGELDPVPSARRGFELKDAGPGASQARTWILQHLPRCIDPELLNKALLLGVPSLQRLAPTRAGCSEMTE